MAKNNTTRSTKKRVKVKDLPAAKQKLTTKQKKSVKGGISTAGGGVWKSKDGGQTWLP